MKLLTPAIYSGVKRALCIHRLSICIHGQCRKHIHKTFLSKSQIEVDMKIHTRESGARFAEAANGAAQCVSPKDRQWSCSRCLSFTGACARCRSGQQSTAAPPHCRRLQVPPACCPA
jgi:hypothetical protein